MSAVQSPPQHLVGAQFVLLDRVNWKAYEALAESWAGLPRRVTYDRGRLEIMSPLPIHERIKALVGLLIKAYLVERGLGFHLGGSMTFKLPDKQRGLEPDECYWVQNAARMRGRDEYDPETDPPPDLAVDVDITSSSLPRMSIYADLQVPEVWRYKDDALTIHLLKGGEYRPSDVGLALPALTGGAITRFLALRNEGDAAVVAAFLRWARGENKTRRRPPRK